MIRTVHIENYKSITNLDLELGRVTVLIGANGSGKSNLLEAVAIASAASQDKLENEFLSSRGIRVTETRFMRAAFEIPPARFSKHGEVAVDGSLLLEKTEIEISGESGVAFGCELEPDEGTSYPRWNTTFKTRAEDFRSYLKSIGLPADADVTFEILRSVMMRKSGTLPGFLIYAPENSSLRIFQSEGQILPLGYKGEGLFAHLKWLHAPAHADRLLKIKEKLDLIDWFETFDIPSDLAPGERSIRIRDRYLPAGVLFDQRSANEGFLFLLFYLTLFLSPETPAFFAIDNVDASLNPKLCTEMIRQLASLAAEYDKQVIFTTHNPAILDGLDLANPEHRLIVVDRNKSGHTRVRRVEAPKPGSGESPVSLSAAFTRGYIGGLPKNF